MDNLSLILKKIDFLTLYDNFCTADVFEEKDDSSAVQVEPAFCSS